MKMDIVVSLSTFVGGFVMYVLNLHTINTTLLGILLSITLGMLLFITFNELFPRIRGLKNKKTAVIAIIIGILLQIISLFVHIH